MKKRFTKEELVKIDFYAIKADWVKFSEIAEKELLSASALLRRSSFHSPATWHIVHAKLCLSSKVHRPRENLWG